MGLVSELKRRNVFRMAVLYAVATWFIMQVAEVVIGLANLPDWIGPTILGLLALGFPIALIFSWFYEMTPEGISLESDVDVGKSITHIRSRRFDVLVISLLCAAVILFAYDKWGMSEPPDKSIAVLPFVNMSPDPDQEYFSDGLSDTLIHVLAQVSGLKVTAKTSSFYFKDKNIDIVEIAKKLNVGTILEGSVQRSGDRIRVIAQLIDAGHGTHLWSKSFDRDLTDLFAVQDEIAQEVVKALKVTLLDSEEDRLANRYQPTLDAYEQLILGRHEKAKHTANSLDAAEQHFKRAIQIDLNYALAYVDLAETYSLQVGWSGLLFDESLKRQEPLIEKALKLDPLSGEAYAIRATFRRHRQLITGEVEHGIEDEYLKAITLTPNYATAHILYSQLLAGQSRLEERLVQLRVAAELDPMSPNIQLSVATATWDMGRVEEALTMIRHIIENVPEFPDSYIFMARFQIRAGHLGTAQAWFQEARRRNPGDAYTWYEECVNFLNLGDVLSAEECVWQLNEAYPEKGISRSAQLVLNAYRGHWKVAILDLEVQLEWVPGYRPFSWQLADLVARQGDLQRARQLMAAEYPALLGVEPELSVGELIPALIVAAVFHANGDVQRRDVLLMAMEELIASMHRTRGISYGLLDVYIHAMRGDRDRAIAGLREAIDVGWRGGSVGGSLVGSWWMLRQDWKLASLHEDPEFIAMVNELEADIRKQRQWYEEHKDEPLF